MIIPVTVPAERVIGHESLPAERKVGPLHIVRQIYVVMVGSVEAVNTNKYYATLK